jgi:hypothetical protein
MQPADNAPTFNVKQKRFTCESNIGTRPGPIPSLRFGRCATYRRRVTAAASTPAINAAATADRP